MINSQICNMGTLNTRINANCHLFAFRELEVSIIFTYSFRECDLKTQKYVLGGFKGLYCNFIASLCVMSSFLWALLMLTLTFERRDLVIKWKCEVSLEISNIYRYVFYVSNENICKVYQYQPSYDLSCLNQMKVCRGNSMLTSIVIYSNVLLSMYVTFVVCTMYVRSSYPGLNRR